MKTNFLSGELSRLVLSVPFVLVILSAGCKHAPTDPTVFRWNIASGLNSLDPAQMASVAAGQVGLQIFEGLVRLDSAGHVQPSLATRWDISGDGKSWAFVIRSNVRFHDDQCFPEGKGRLLTAHDVQYSFERICDARSGSTGWWMFHGRVEGADAFHDDVERAAVKHVAGINVPNDSTIVIRLTRSFAPFLSMLTMPYGFVMAHEAAEKYGANVFQHPVGTGPFRLDHWVPDQELELRKNNLYWQTTLGSIEQSIVTFAHDVKTEFLEFTRGNYDVTNAIPQGFETVVFDSNGALGTEYAKYRLLSLPALTTEYYGILLDPTADAATQGPLAANQKVRQALNYAVDRESIVRYVMRGQAVAARGVLPPGVEGFDSTREGYAFNPAKAGALLAEAGYPNGKGLPTMTLQLGPSEQTASVAEAVQQQWKRIGVNVELRQVDFPQHLDMIRSEKLPLWRTQWVADYCDAENFLSLFASENFSPGGPNTTHYSNSRFDALYAKSLDATLAAKERNRLYGSMDSLVTDAAPWIFLYYPRTVRLLQPSITKFTCDPLGRFTIADIVKR